MQLAKGDVLGGQVGLDLEGDLGLRLVGRGEPNRANQLGVQVTQHVPLVAIHPQAARLAAVTHLWSAIEIRRSRATP